VKRLAFFLLLSGTFIVMAVPAHGQTFSVLYAFRGKHGLAPEGDLILDHSGNVYGTTAGGGNATACGVSGCGVVFKLKRSGGETILYDFAGGSDGAAPQGRLVRDKSGNIYGTTSDGGDFGWGTIYKLDKSGVETVLYTFTGGTDGGFPVANLLRDGEGNLYGTTFNGGDLTACDGQGCGVVFKLDAMGVYSVLYTFTGGADGANPAAGLVRDGLGNLYGTTYAGGNLSICNFRGCGVVFKVRPTGKEIVLHTFMLGTDGGNPDNSGLVRDSAGNFYGTTANGGNISHCGGGGCGVIFKLDASGNNFTVVYDFVGKTQGNHPFSGVILDEAGNFYGTTYMGGSRLCEDNEGCGTVFKVDSAGNYTKLYTFTGMTDGAYPGGLAMDATGALYGTTLLGGDLSHCHGYGCGVVFKVIP